MTNGIEELNNNINNGCKSLNKDNNSLINAFKVRLIKRLLIVFNKYEIPFSKDKLETSISDYLINNIDDICLELSKNYKNLLFKYFDIVNDYYHTHSDSKNKIKEVTKVFVNKIYGKQSDVLNKNIANNFLTDINSKILVYDNYYLNKEIEKRINEDFIEIVHELSKNYNNYLIDSMKIILKVILENNDQ